MRAVAEHGTPLVEDPARLDDVRALGVDEHVWQHARPRRRTGYATAGKVYADWIIEREQTWRDAIEVAALDPFRGYATALRTCLPQATRVLDAVHVVALGNTAVDQVRRRVQQQQLGHRGHKHDPLYEVRRLLRRGAETLTETNRAKVEAALQAGDPDWEVTIAWHYAQRLRGIYHADTAAAGRAQAEQLLQSLPTCPIPEIARLGRTLGSWRAELLAYFDTDGASNGPTEAINLLVEKARRLGHGFRNFHNYRLRLLLLCGVTWHTPQTPRIRGRHPRLVA